MASPPPPPRPEPPTTRLRRQWRRLGAAPSLRQATLRNRFAADQPWRFVFGALVALAPALLLRLVAPGLPVSTPGAVLLVAVALATYTADWVGGLTALGVSLLSLEFLFVDERGETGLPSGREDAIGLAIVALAGLALIALIQWIKSEGMAERQATLAARSAATALSAIETVAATEHTLDAAGRARLYEASVRALVGATRAHAGALYLEDPVSGTFSPVAAYGFGRDADRLPSGVAPGSGLVGQVVEERRPVGFANLRKGGRAEGTGLDLPGIRAVLAAPVMGSGDHVLGVALIALLAEHQFSGGETRRLQALANQLAGIIQTMTTTDARESALQQAREELLQLEMVIAALPEAVVVASPPTWRIVAANAAARDLFGDLSGGAIERAFVLPDGSDAPSETLPMTETASTGIAAVDRELAVVTPDGRTIPVLASAVPITADDGVVTAVVGAFRDIGPLKEAARVKDEFISVVSHELRSPLTPIRGFVQLVARELDREGGHDLQVTRLTSIAGHVDRMTRLVDDLLDVSRLRSGALEIRPERVDLVALAADLVALRAASTTGHDLRFAPADAEVWGMWDPDRIQQVMDNLIGNAVKYSPAGGAVTVVVAQDGDAELARILVEDEGPGLTAAEQAEVFAAFYRTESAIAGRMPGLGLGLYISSELVHAHGGTIRAENRESGGARFVVELPQDGTTPAAGPA